jgi:HPt (histidine-containing phosphotransfer) domain-containing protein
MLGKLRLEFMLPLPLSFSTGDLLERVMEDDAVAQKIVEGFLDDMPRQIAALRGYLDSWSAPDAERQAHAIKGASANVGGEALRALAFEMEKAGKAGDLVPVRARMDGLEPDRILVRRNHRAQAGGGRPDHLVW